MVRHVASLGHIILIRANQSLLFLLNALCLLEKLPVPSLISGWTRSGSNQRSTALEASTLTIAVLIVYMLTSSKLLMHNCWFDCHTKHCIVDDGLIRNVMLCNDQHVSYWVASSEECGILHTRGTPSLPVLKAVDCNAHPPPVGRLYSKTGLLCHISVLRSFPPERTMKWLLYVCLQKSVHRKKLIIIYF